MEWQPIDNAPKDGTWMDIWVIYPNGHSTGLRIKGCRFGLSYWAKFTDTPQLVTNVRDTSEPHRDVTVDVNYEWAGYVVTHYLIVTPPERTQV